MTDVPPLPYEPTPDVPKGAAKLLSSRNGKPRDPRGRKEGALPGQGRFSAGLKESILEAAQRVGRDGNGEDGLVGYLEVVARSDVKAFCALLARVLPMTLNGTGEGGGIVVEIVKRTYAAADAAG